jgi:iron complex transport system substrate-binding protein
MKNKPHLIRLILVLIALVTVITACGSPAAPTSIPTQALVAETQAPSSPTPEQLTFTDGLDRQVTLGKPAQKIISIAPSNTEILYALGAGSQVIGRDSFSDYPEEAKALPDVGGGWGELNTEQIVSLQPDLVLAAQINTAEQVKTLEDLGLTVFYLANPKDFDGLYTNLQTVARLTGRQTEAETLIASLKKRVHTVQEKVAPLSNHPLVFYELDSTNPNAPYTSGPGTFIDLLINMAGAENLGSTLQAEWAQVSVEELIKRNPDMILLGDYVYGGIKPEDVAARPGWGAIKAVKEGKILPFDDNLVSRPGPRLVDGLEALVKALHPDSTQ